jgi:hypothetical protein
MAFEGAAVSARQAQAAASASVVLLIGFMGA